jgi:shikimate kinase
MIEHENSITIGEMFARHGEAYFRAREKEAVARVARRRKAVIATGGRRRLDPANMERLRAAALSSA